MTEDGGGWESHGGLQEPEDQYVA
ncbi:uncharacterized protein G2W53_043940 [Senna tora]|uniref:Uncharacterized protein n=1 Tax=Senna tora TaxID=362788 RepID=A0A834W5E6_9FABA|nr:uncharacterized protein G2W53_043940 [Senna tora]